MTKSTEKKGKLLGWSIMVNSDFVVGFDTESTLAGNLDFIDGGGIALFTEREEAQRVARNLIRRQTWDVFTTRTVPIYQVRA